VGEKESRRRRRKIREQTSEIEKHRKKCERIRETRRRKKKINIDAGAE
jgi:50S ribosomal subunit-associated GTPase HflX